MLSESLVREFGAASGTAFAGMIGPVNRRAAKIVGRPLIEYPSADPAARVWRIAPEDAKGCWTRSTRSSAGAVPPSR